MRIDLNETEMIKKYISIKEPETSLVFDTNVFKLIEVIIGKGDNKALVSDSRLHLRLSRLAGARCYAYTDLVSEAFRGFTFQDSLFLLAKKKIPVFFYNRVGLQEGFSYLKSADKRMKAGKSFPKMYRDIESNEKDLRELFGDKYSKMYVEEIGKIPQIIKVGNWYCHEDCQRQYVNVINGKRVTTNAPKCSCRKMHVYGRCGVFGYAVEDCDTIPSLLQKFLIEEGYDDIQVINHGLWGGDDYMLDNNFFFDVQDIKEGDIVVFYRYHNNHNIIRWFEQYGLYYKDPTVEWHSFPEAKWCFYDKPGHMNSDGYKNVAQIIFNDMKEKRFEAKEVDFSSLETTGVSSLHEYIEKNENLDFDTSIKEYLQDVVKKSGGVKGKCNGAIVMNCNPFTYGHRYLIKCAAENVDYLYIFVVEENKSFFDYSDRYEMVVEGTKDIDNVIVVNSGKFIISSYTFPEYFMKDYVKEKNFDVSNDINIFCKYIAPELSIKKRFVGEEPFDPVTNNYNETMKKILPLYDMELFEIKRKMIDESRVINATYVRKLLSKNKLEELKEYVPETTYKILIEKYVR